MTTFEILCKCILKAHKNMWKIGTPRREKKGTDVNNFSCVELLELYELLVLFVALIVNMLQS